MSRLYVPIVFLTHCDLYRRFPRRTSSCELCMTGLTASMQYSERAGYVAKFWGYGCYLHQSREIRLLMKFTLALHFTSVLFRFMKAQKEGEAFKGSLQGERPKLRRNDIRAWYGAMRVNLAVSCYDLSHGVFGFAHVEGSFHYCTDFTSRQTYWVDTIRKNLGSKEGRFHHCHVTNDVIML